MDFKESAIRFSILKLWQCQVSKACSFGGRNRTLTTHTPAENMSTQNSYPRGIMPTVIYA